MDLLPPDTVKTIHLSLDINRVIPRIVTIGQATSNFFDTMDEISIKLDETEKFNDWGRDPQEFFQAFGNILLTINEKNLLAINADFQELGEES